MPVALPPLGAELLEPPDADEVLMLSRGVVSAVMPADGLSELQKVLIEMLPAAYRQTLISLEEATHELQDLYAQHALPHILGYSSLAATAGAIPIPWVDLLVLPGIQSRMIYHLAQLYGQR